MAITFAPIYPYHWLVGGLAGATVCLLLLRLFLPHGLDILGRRPLTRLLVFIFSLAAALSLIAAAHNPQFLRKPSVPTVHLAVVLDVSESVLRSEAKWSAALDEIGELLSVAVSTMPEEMAVNGTGSLMTFGRGVNVVGREFPLMELPTIFRRLTSADFAIGDATNIQVALEQAEQNIRRGGQRGAILLITDGNQTDGNASETAGSLARQGIPILVFPLTSSPPSLAITSAYLPAQIDGRTEATLRAVMQNYSDQDVLAGLAIRQNPNFDNLTTHFGIAQYSEIPLFEMPAENWMSLREPLRFEGIGLQFVDLILTPAEGQGIHQRRLYTHVLRPVHIMAVGGDNRWIKALAPENVIVTQMMAAELPPSYDFQEIDALVLSGVAAAEFRPGVLSAVAQAVDKDGLGLFVMNGDHAGGDEKTPTVLMSYEETPIAPLLPITTDPRVVFDEPPTRHVVILIDASGSMATPLDGGFSRLDKAKETAIHIIRELLRPTDYLDVIVFSTGAGHLVEDRLMNTAGKDYAVAQIGGIGIGGGTDPTEALRLVSGRHLTHCGLIFVSDGELDPRTLSARPDCRYTVFLVGLSDVPANAPTRLLADPIPVPGSFNPASITIPYFEPEPRDTFFEPGEYTPFTAEYFSAQIDRLPVPGLPLEGTAVTALKDEDNVVLTAARPLFTDPVLAYKAAGAGYVGAFTTAIPMSWLDNDEGCKAIEAWIKRTVPYSERDRYELRLQDHGGDIVIQIGIMAQLDEEIEVTDLIVTLELEGQSLLPIVMRRQETAPGLFSGKIRLSRAEETQLAMLVIQEKGPHAVSRPQRIPLIIGPAASIEQVSTAEVTSYGLNENLLKTIVEMSGGVYDLPVGSTFFRGLPAEISLTELWPHISLLAAVFYLLAVAIKRLES